MSSLADERIIARHVLYRKISYAEECGLKCCIGKHWPYFVEFYMRGVGGTDEKVYRAWNALRREGVIDEQNNFTETWREAVVEVAKGRSGYELNMDDMRLIVEAWWRLEFRPKKNSDSITTIAQ
jgi:hypothetical protein